MQQPSKDVLAIVEACMSGSLLTHEQALRLCEIEAYTPDWYLLMYARRSKIVEASGGVAEVHGQIGIDANPCPGDCEFCSFATINSARSNERLEMPLDRILKYAREYYDNGANCLTVMITIDYDFDQYLSYIEAIHKELPDFPIMANMGDFDLSMAQELKSVGVGSVYHAIRMGEGIVTRLSVADRVKSIQSAHEAGLKVATCTEMISPAYSYEEIVQAIEREVSLEPEAGFTGGMIPVPGTKMYEASRYSWAKGDVFSAILRLMTPADRMPFGAGNMAWAEVGTNPRDDKEETEKGGMGPDLYKSRMRFENEEWKVPFGPSKYW